MTEQELLVDCLRRLNGLDLTYYLTGSMASNYWGIPRTTHDLDFVIQLPPSAVADLVRIWMGNMLRSVGCRDSRRRNAQTPARDATALGSEHSLERGQVFFRVEDRSYRDLKIFHHATGDGPRVELE